MKARSHNLSLADQTDSAYRQPPVQDKDYTLQTRNHKKDSPQSLWARTIQEKNGQSEQPVISNYAA